MPKVLDVSLLDEFVRVTSHDAVTMARRLATVSEGCPWAAVLLSGAAAVRAPCEGGRGAACWVLPAPRACQLCEIKPDKSWYCLPLAACSLQEEGILCGISSGAAVQAAIK